MNLSGLLAKDNTKTGKVDYPAQTLGLLSNPQRLRILCHLTDEGELSVGALVERLDLSPSALSQHLAKLREHDMVETRKVSQSVYYRISRPDIKRILELLHELYCK